MQPPHNLGRGDLRTLRAVWKRDTGPPSPRTPTLAMHTALGCGSGVVTSSVPSPRVPTCDVASLGQWRGELSRKAWKCAGGK